MRVLVLTDHETHADGESIYPLLKEMARHEPSAELFVATRGRKENQAFFREGDETRLVARPIDNRFQYRKNGAWFVGWKFLKWFWTPGVEVDACDFDAIFLRVDRPVSDAFLDSLAERFPDQKIINDPKGIQETGAKDFLLHFRDLCPEMWLCHSMQEVDDVVNRHNVVLKPLRGYGGKGLVHVDGERAWRGTVEETYAAVRPDLEKTLRKEGQLLAVEFLPTIDQGDKRIVLVNGQTVGAMLRKPVKGSWLANMTQGGTSEFARIDPEEQMIAEKISPEIVKRGVVVFGFDTLVHPQRGRLLSEINTLNVGGFYEAGEHAKKPVVSDAARLIWDYLLGR